jgi:uncharacterized protein (DUF486 family)
MAEGNGFTLTVTDVDAELIQPSREVALTAYTPEAIAVYDEPVAPLIFVPFNVHWKVEPVTSELASRTCVAGVQMFIGPV